MKKRLLAMVLSLILVFGNVSGVLAENEEADGGSGGSTKQTVSATQPFREMTAAEIVAEMGTGWNLGNTMDGHTGFTPNETLWQNVETTQEIIKTVHDLGFNTIRVPVTWGTMIDDENDYLINEKWMSRVQDIVDYAINMNMYVIINVHHDGAEQSGWLHIAAEDTAPIKVKYEAVWRQIAERFRDYDEHLIFESMNEVTGPGNSVAEDTAVIMEFNQIFVDTVRATGGNNTERWLSVPGRYTNITNTTGASSGFALPKDSTENRIFVSVHHYDWTFGLQENMNDTTWTESETRALKSEFKKLYDTFTSKGIPVILGEYGAVNKNNTEERTYHMEVVNYLCQLYGVVPVYWDQGWYDLSLTPDYSFSLIDRATCTAVYPEIIASIMRGYYYAKEPVKGTEITPITDLGEETETVTLTMGEVQQISLAERVSMGGSNDVILWKSADETVATVNGNAGDRTAWFADIHAIGIGYTTITAYSYEGEAVLKIPVVVKAAVVENAVTDIIPECESYELYEEEYIFLNCTTSPTTTDAWLTYRSSNPEVASVSVLGKVLAKAPGTAYIIITSSDGYSETVKVTVTEREASAEMLLALNVYYNDAIHEYYANETGDAITVSGDGQYTVCFDFEKNISGQALTSGVTGITNLTAIYIKDDSVTKGLASKSPLVSCDIIYDEIVIDGKSYTVNMTEPKSALKSSGIFDTNDPINSWDGSVISEVSVNNHVLTFKDNPNPKYIEVTFTLSNMVFEEGAAPIEKPEATEIKAVQDTLEVTGLTGSGVSLTVSPADSGKVTLVSSNPSVVSISHLAVEPDAKGGVRLPVYGLSNGEATITAYTENGLTAQIAVTVNLEEAEPEMTPTPEATPTVEPTKEPPQVPTETPGADADDSEEPKDGSPLTTVLWCVLGAVLAVAAFGVTYKLAGGKKGEAEPQKSNEAEETSKETEE